MPKDLELRNRRDELVPLTPIHSLLLLPSCLSLSLHISLSSTYFSCLIWIFWQTVYWSLTQMFSKEFSGSILTISKSLRIYALQKLNLVVNVKVYSLFQDDELQRSCAYYLKQEIKVTGISLLILPVLVDGIINQWIKLKTCESATFPLNMLPSKQLPKYFSYQLPPLTIPQPEFHLMSPLNLTHPLASTFCPLQYIPHTKKKLTFYKTES